MKLYVTGPMTGLPEFNYPAFRAAGARLQLAGFEVLNPIDAEEHNVTGQPQAWDWYMRHALRMVLDADGLAVLPGAALSRGARLEIHVAAALGLPIRDVAVWTAEGPS
jgi:hypothetical protein